MCKCHKSPFRAFPPPKFAKIFPSFKVCKKFFLKDTNPTPGCPRCTMNRSRYTTPSPGCP